MSLQWIHNKMSNLYAISPLVLLIAFVSFQGNAQKVNVAKMSNQEVFKNVFFGEGELAASIPQLAELNIRNFTSDASQIQRAEQFQDKITTAISKRYPSYMPSLKAAILSGDRTKISKTIIEGARYLDEVVWTLEEGIDSKVRAKLTRELTARVNKNSTSSEDIDQVVSTYVEQTAKETATEEELACVLVLVVAVAVAVALALWVVYTVELAEAESTLAHEQIVDDIATTAY